MPGYDDVLASFSGWEGDDLTSEGRGGEEPSSREGALGLVRERLDDRWQEIDEGVFVRTGRDRGCAFAEARVEVGSDGLCRLTIDPHAVVPEERRREMSRWARRVSNNLIVEGLTVDQDGRVLFVAKNPVDVLNGEDLDECVGKGFSTIHGYMGDITAMIYAGVRPWEIEGLSGADACRSASAGDGADAGHGDEDEDEGIAAIIERLCGGN